MILQSLVIVRLIYLIICVTKTTFVGGGGILHNLIKTTPAILQTTLSKSNYIYI